VEIARGISKVDISDKSPDEVKGVLEQIWSEMYQEEEKPKWNQLRPTEINTAIIIQSMEDLENFYGKEIIQEFRKENPMLEL